MDGKTEPPVVELVVNEAKLACTRRACFVKLTRIPIPIVDSDYSDTKNRTTEGENVAIGRHSFSVDHKRLRTSKTEAVEFYANYCHLYFASAPRLIRSQESFYYDG